MEDAEAKRGSKVKGVKNLHLGEIRTKQALKVRTSNQNCEVGGQNDGN